MKEKEILKDAMYVVRCAEDSGTYGNEMALDFIEKYPEEYEKYCEEYKNNSEDEEDAENEAFDVQDFSEEVLENLKKRDNNEAVLEEIEIRVMPGELDTYFEQKINVKVKGEKHGLCNRGICLSPKDVVIYNKGTRKYYCPECAILINNANMPRPNDTDNEKRVFAGDLLLCMTDDKESPYIYRSRMYRIRMKHEQRNG